MKSSILSGCRPHSNQGFSLSWWLQLNNWNRAPCEHNQPQMAKCLTMSQLQGTVSRAFCSGLWLLVPLCKGLHSNAAGLNTEMDLQIRNGRNGLNFRLCQALENLTVIFKLKKKNLSFSEVNYPSICQISAMPNEMNSWSEQKGYRVLSVNQIAQLAYYVVSSPVWNANNELAWDCVKYFWFP